jgi:hypothetical protein
MKIAEGPQWVWESVALGAVEETVGRGSGGQLKAGARIDDGTLKGVAGQECHRVSAVVEIAHSQRGPRILV